MVRYLWIIVYLLVWMYFEKKAPCYVDKPTIAESKFVQGEPNKRIKYFISLLIIGSIILWAGYRSFTFEDTFAYTKNFNNYPGDWQGFLDYIPTLKKDKTFYIASAFMKLLFTDPRMYLILLAAFHGLSVSKFFRRFSESYVTSVFLFVASTNVIEWLCNGIRQFTAVCFVLFAAPFILKKKYVGAIIFILIGSLFHQSALLVLPFIFIVQGKAWNRKTVIFLIAIILAVTMIGQFTNLMDSALSDTQYKNVVSDYTSSNDDGTNPIRVLVYSIPAILAFWGKKKILDEGGTLINVATNMSIVTAGFYFISMFTSGIFIGRIPIYFSLFNYILLPWEIEHLFDKNKNVVKYIMVVLYTGFYIYSTIGLW